MRFELTVLRICNPLHWAALPPVHKFGVPPRTRTLTDGFGDRGAAITPEIRKWYQRRESNPLKNANLALKGL